MRTMIGVTLGLALLAGTPLAAQTLAPDTPKTFTPVTDSFDYIQRKVDIAMRDGVKLHAVILMHKGLKGAPILLDRTPYNASSALSRAESAHGDMLVRASDALFLDAGYILVYEDVRGKHGSKGDYVNERPLRGPLNPTKVDHATDAWDTIDWLVKNVPETNGRVGMIGTSYDLSARRIGERFRQEPGARSARLRPQAARPSCL
jgi:predicted acyl esterase